MGRLPAGVMAADNFIHRELSQRIDQRLVDEGRRRYLYWRRQEGRRCNGYLALWKVIIDRAWDTLGIHLNGIVSICGGEANIIRELGVKLFEFWHCLIDRVGIHAPVEDRKVGNFERFLRVGKGGVWINA